MCNLLHFQSNLPNTAYSQLKNSIQTKIQMPQRTIQESLFCVVPTRITKRKRHLLKSGRLMANVNKITVSILKHVSKWNISEEMEEELSHLKPRPTRPK